VAARLEKFGGHDRRKRPSASISTGDWLRLWQNKASSASRIKTPLEFASQVGLSEAASITKAYNRVRYGEEKLSAAERAQIELVTIAGLNAAGSRIETQRNANRCLEYNLVGLLDAIKAD